MALKAIMLRKKLNDAQKALDTLRERMQSLKSARQNLRHPSKRPQRRKNAMR